TFSAKLPGLSIPHLLQPPEVNRFLWGVYVEREQALQSAEVKNSQADRPLPGRNLSRAELRKKVEPEVSRMTKSVLHGKAACGLCHCEEGKKGAAIPDRGLPINVPEVWYPDARFSHRPHRAMACADCHKDVERSETEKDVLIPGVENCLQCHSAARTEG